LLPGVFNGGLVEGNENEAFTGEGGMDVAAVEHDALDDVEENEFVELLEVELDDDDPDTDKPVVLDEKEKVDEP
jgi:hypothetical protein